MHSRPADRGPVLVTGCSSGIGRAACVRLIRAGYTVYASARSTEAIEDLHALGCRILRVDVTEEESLLEAIEVIATEVGPVAMLVNNAGYGLYGPIEQLSIDEVRQQFETNVFGLVRLTQLVLPGMRERGGGRIVNVSSIAGRMTFPGGAFYHASKFALEALSDVLRIEVAPFGVKVVVVEPGPVRNTWSERAARSLPLDISTDGNDPYGDYKIAIAGMLLGREEKRPGVFAATSDDVAAVIVRALSARRPKTRYMMNRPTKALTSLRALVPDRVYDAMVRKQFRIP